MLIREATATDRAAIGAIIMPVIREGATYALEPDLTEAEALDYWLGADRTTFVAEQGERIVGTYYLRANQPGGGAHVCNCGYMTCATVRGQGVARQMWSHSIEAARQAGFRAMQFNFVVSTNLAAVQLWQRLGYATVGRLPEAFSHPTHGLVDALVMHRRL